MKNPDINKYKSLGKYIEAKIKYLKQEGYYKSKEEISNLLGFSNRSGIYHLIYGTMNVDLNKIKIYKKAFMLTKEEEERFCLLACYSKADNPFEKKLFNNLLKS